ncbi:YigZ family protein [Moraxella caviae]|uniref:IMPACT family member yigZ n=1 Tax=Moraxella caviae TaxID=34060 RepID=A0A1T0A7D6_9GAMM|nr:YigZ family protein [Moraxella caviae]OOR91666.1 YigZ family protein [Moraxella caviae]STZ10416.1 IMPACT family member yigZ [Moraxella caviae]
MSYHTLAAPVSAVYEIKKSEFLAFAYPITNREMAMACVQSLKVRYPDARHHCFGYIIGDPHNTTSAGFDDDGEPNGTAGRPILNVLQHKAIGNVLVVVVRYFGGIKLGAGGLTRAYATATQMAVDEMELTPFVPKSTVQVVSEFAQEAQLRYLIAQAAGEILASDYDSQVKLTVQLDSEKVAQFTESLGMVGRVLDDDE